MKICVSNLCYKVKDKSGERNILNYINYEFDYGKITTISGSSGSGKTTFLYALAGILDINEGSVVVMDESIYDLSPIKRDMFRLQNMSLIYQNLNLLSFMSVEDNILLPFYLRNMSVDETVRNKIKEYMEILGLGQVQKKSIDMLSGGEQQRVSIIRAFIANPRIILCDEPTGSLDRENTMKFMNSIKEMNKIEKTTVILVSHDEEVYSYGDRKIKMIDGNIVS